MVSAALEILRLPNLSSGGCRSRSRSTTGWWQRRKNPLGVHECRNQGGVQVEGQFPQVIAIVSPLPHPIEPIGNPFGFSNSDAATQRPMILGFAFRLKPQLRLGVVANMAKSAVVGPANGGAQKGFSVRLAGCLPLQEPTEIDVIFPLKRHDLCRVRGNRLLPGSVPRRCTVRR